MSHYIKKIKKDILLEKAFNYVIENNQSSNLPYHDTRHSMKVFNSAMEMAKGYKIPKTEIIELGVACLFHDFNHSGGKLKDGENIQIAIEEFMKFYKSNKSYFKDIYHVSITNLIYHTEFPKIIEPSHITQKIIMDSDLIQCYDIDWVLFAIKGLADERGVSVQQALMDQRNFINNVDFYTKYAKKLHKKEKKKYLKRLDYLKTIFN